MFTRGKLVALLATFRNRRRGAAAQQWCWVGSATPAVVAVGHSHRQALVSAIEADLVGFHAAVLTNCREQDPVVNSAYWDRFRLLSPEIPAAILWSGNEMNVRYLFEHDVPFTFADLGDSGTRLVVPVELVRAQAVDVLRPLERLLDESGRTNVALVGPPPPKTDDAIRSNLTAENYFKKLLDQRGLSETDVTLNPFELRLRLWQIYRQALAEIARRHDVPLLAPVSGVVSDEGALLGEFSRSDVTHANERYGALVWQALADHFGVARS